MGKALLAPCKEEESNEADEGAVEANVAERLGGLIMRRTCLAPAEPIRERTHPMAEDPDVSKNGLEEIPDLSTWPPEVRESLMRDLNAMQRVADRHAAGEITEAEMESEYFRLLEEREKGLGAGG